MAKGDGELDDDLRERVIEAALRYQDARDPEAKTAYLSALTAFKQYVLHGNRHEANRAVWRCFAVWRCLGTGYSITKLICSTVTFTF